MPAYELAGARLLEPLGGTFMCFELWHWTEILGKLQPFQDSTEG
jgi:hypothetical protein